MSEQEELFPFYWGSIHLPKHNFFEACNECLFHGLSIELCEMTPECHVSHIVASIPQLGGTFKIIRLSHIISTFHTGESLDGVVYYSPVLRTRIVVTDDGVIVNIVGQYLITQNILDAYIYVSCIVKIYNNAIYWGLEGKQIHSSTERIEE